MPFAKQDNKPTLETPQHRRVEIQVGTEAGPAELSGQRRVSTQAGAPAPSSAASESIARLPGSQVTPEARFLFKINQLFVYYCCS